MGVWVAGAQPPASTKRKTCFVLERGERGGEAAAPAGRKLPHEARAARSRGRAKTRFEPSVSRIWQKQNVLAYVCDILYICFSLYYLYSVCHRAPTHGGLGCRGAAPCHECAPSLYKKSEQAMYSLLRHEKKKQI